MNQFKDYSINTFENTPIEEKYLVLINHLNDGILIAQDEKIKYANNSLLKLSVYTADEMPGMNFFNLIHPDEHSRIKELNQKRMEGTEVPEFYEITFIGKNGENIIF